MLTPVNLVYNHSVFHRGLEAVRTGGERSFWRSEEGWNPSETAEGLS